MAFAQRMNIKPLSQQADLPLGYAKLCDSENWRKVPPPPLHSNTVFTVDGTEKERLYVLFLTVLLKEAVPATYPQGHFIEVVRGMTALVSSKNRDLPVALPVVPQQFELSGVKAAAARCKACDLWKHGTQTVFGEGSSHARLMFVGEQPGDREDIEGRPFVGPAGSLLDKALNEAGINRSLVYVTNAVKHFKWAPDPRGKRRIHKKPGYSEIQACHPWLEAEIRLSPPKRVGVSWSHCCSGATREGFQCHSPAGTVD